MAGIKDILTADWSEIRSLNRRELSKITSVLASAANKRLKRFQQAGEISPSVTYAEKGGGKFSVAGKNVNQLRSEFVRAKTFLSQQESTVRNWRRIKRDTVKTLKGMGVELDPADFDEVMQLYGDVKAEYPEIRDDEIYAPVIQQIYEERQQGIDEDMIKDRAKASMMQRYEERERANNDFFTQGVSGLIRREDL